ncbi:MAG: hypothetical protein AAGG75_21425 [Bacteroidota bacterium]
MKFLFGLISTALLTWLLLGTLGLPWWTMALIAGLVGALIGENGFKSFLYGFLAIFMLWGVMAWMANTANEGLLAARLGELFGGLSSNLLILATALIGALVGGMGALSGSLAAQLGKKRR